MIRTDFAEGYYIFMADSVENRGMAAAGVMLREQVREAEKDYDITFLSGPAIKEDNSAGREVYFAYQGAVLKRKGK